MGEAVVADLLKTPRQDMLQEPPDELVGRHGQGPRAATAALAVREGDASQTVRSGFALDDAPLTDRHAVDIGRQILNRYRQLHDV
jgi:hypothetical protein